MLTSSSLLKNYKKERKEKKRKSSMRQVKKAMKMEKKTKEKWFGKQKQREDETKVN